MEEGKSSTELQSRPMPIAYRRTRRTALLAGSPAPEPETKSQQIADKGDASPSEVALQDVLRRFKSFDKSSPQFPDQLMDLLSGEEYKSRVTRFQDEEVAWIVDYLDNVCVCVALYLFAAELVQVLDVLDSFNPAHRICLRELQEICGARRKLPRSYIPRICMDETRGHDHCGPGEIFQWSLYMDGSVEFRRIFSIHKGFFLEETEVGCFSGVAIFPYARY